MDKSKQIKVLIISGVGGLLFIMAIIGIVTIVNQINDRNKKDAIYISNLSSCSQNMQKPLEESMRTNMYNQIKAANDYNKKETLPRYESVIRDGSCTETDLTSNSINGKESKSKETVAILDIPEAQQSWKITYHWVKDGEPILTDLGTIVTPTCLAKEELVYGDFNCEKILSLAQYGTDKYDPILQYMPYEGKGFELTYNPDTREVNAVIVVRPSQKDNQELLKNLQGQVEYWFSYRKLDINSYNVKYTYTNTIDYSGDQSYGD